MNDEIKRLLELAAKAAGIAGRFDVDCIRAEAGVDSSGSTCWQPHLDDGDSRRLEVALGIGMRHHQGWSEVFHPMIGSHEFKHGDCAVAATRLAVLRAAAAIGEAMP